MTGDKGHGRVVPAGAEWAEGRLGAEHEAPGLRGSKVEGPSAPSRRSLRASQADRSEPPERSTRRP